MYKSQYGFRSNQSSELAYLTAVDNNFGNLDLKN